MKKNIKIYTFLWAVLTIIFNVIIFITPNKILGVTRFDKPAFWIAYALIIVSDIAVFCLSLFFLKEKSKSKTFLQIPLIMVSYLCLGVSVAVSLIFMLIPVIPAWIGGVICLVLTGIYIFAGVSAKSAESIISAIDENIRNQTEFVRSATLVAKSILNRAKTEETTQVVNKVYEALRYSDPMSTAELAEVEGNISKMLNTLKEVVKAEDIIKVNSICSDLLIEIQDRNDLCKTLKK